MRYLCGLIVLVSVICVLAVFRAQAQEKAASQATSQAASQPTDAWTAADEERYRLIGTAALRPIDPRSMPDYRKSVDLPPAQPWDDVKTITIKKSTTTSIDNYYDGKLIPAAQYKNINELPMIANYWNKELVFPRRLGSPLILW